jgi:hypothetical protein
LGCSDALLKWQGIFRDAAYKHIYILFLLLFIIDNCGATFFIWVLLLNSR